MLPVRGTARFLCAGAAGGRHRCRCSVRGYRPSPLAAVVAVVVVAGSWWLVPCATYRRWRRDLQLLSARPEGPGGVFCAGPRRPSGPCAGGGPRGLAMAWLWCSTGLLFPGLPPHSPAHGGRSKPPANTGNKLPQPLPRKKSTLETPADPLPPLPVPRRESPVVVVAVPPRRPRLAGTDASTAPPLPPTPCPVGFVQNPSSERPPTRLQSETKHYGVRQDLARTVQRISIKVLPAR